MTALKEHPFEINVGVNSLTVRFCVKSFYYSNNRMMSNINLVLLFPCFQPYYAKSKFPLIK